MAGEPPDVLFFLYGGRTARHSVFFIWRGAARCYLGLLLLFLLFPPAVLFPTEGLRHTVHGLTKGNGDLLVLPPILVLPRGDEEQTTVGAGVDAVGGGVVHLCEAVIDDENHGETMIRGRVDDGLLALGDAGRDEDGAVGGLFEAAAFLLLKARRVLAVADDGQQPPCEEGAVAVGVAGDIAVCEKQTALYQGEGIGADEGRGALALQIAAQGGRGEGGVNAAPLGLQAGAVMAALPAALRVVADIGALRLQLARLDGHHVAIAGGEEGRPAGAAV